MSIIPPGIPPGIHPGIPARVPGSAFFFASTAAASHRAGRAGYSEWHGPEHHAIVPGAIITISPDGAKAKVAANVIFKEHKYKKEYYFEDYPKSDAHDIAALYGISLIKSSDGTTI